MADFTYREPGEHEPAPPLEPAQYEKVEAFGFDAPEGDD